MSEEKDPPVASSDIAWRLDARREETVNLLGLDEAEVLAYAVDQQRDMTTVRLALHECLGIMHRLQQQLARYQRALLALTAATRRRGKRR